VIEHTPTTVHATCRLSVHEDAFLRDHVLSGPGSATDPELVGLACVPLMVSLEIMAEACALLTGRTHIALIENVRAFDWIALDDGELELGVSAELVDAATGRCRAVLRQNGNTAVTAEFATTVAAWHEAPAPALGAVQPARWNGQGIYDIGMFHGPIFQSLANIQGWNEDGLDCELTPCSLTGFFDAGERPFMVLNPVLLDAMGQLAACWVAEHVGTDFNCFPSTIARIELYQPRPAELPGIVLRGRQQALDPAQAADIAAARAWSFEAADAAGQPLVRVSGLVNVFFHVPHRFYQARRRPLEGWLGTPLASPGASLLWQLENLDDDFCSQSNGIFLRMLAHSTLGFEEREEWQALPKQTRQRRQWLLGRLAVKEAVRFWLHAATGELVYPSDIVVGHDEYGAPFVGGWWTESLMPAPRVSLTHDAAGSIAAVSADENPVGVDAEQIGRVRRPELLTGAFTASEQAWLALQPAGARDEALLKLWCGKEAAAKWCGTGLQGAPDAFEVTFESGGAERAMVHCNDMIASVFFQRMGNSVIAVAEGEPGISKVNG